MPTGPRSKPPCSGSWRGNDRLAYSWALPGDSTQAGSRGRASPINVAAMADVQHGHCSLFVIYFVNNAVVANSKTPSLSRGELEAALGSRVLSKLPDGIAHATVRFGGKLCQFFLCPAQDQEGVAHLRSDSISAIACSKGMASSPAAFARSKARMDSSSSNSSRSLWYSRMSRTTLTRLPCSSVMYRSLALLKSPSSWNLYGRYEDGRLVLPSSQLRGTNFSAQSQAPPRCYVDRTRQQGDLLICEKP